MLLSRLSWLSRDIIVTCDTVVILTWDHIYQQFLKMCQALVLVLFNLKYPSILKDRILTTNL